MSLSSLTPFEMAGLLTHLAVLVIGVGGTVSVVPLARGRRSGLGLVLMALAMAVLVLQPRLNFGWWAVASYVAGFAVALWMLIGPTSLADKGSEGE